MLRNGYEVSFKNNCCFIADIHESEVVRIEMNGNSFYLKLDAIEGYVCSAIADDSLTWHKRYGHYNLKSLKYSHNIGMVDNETMDEVSCISSSLNEKLGFFTKQPSKGREGFDESQMNCAHSENCLHEAREEAQTHLCNANLGIWYTKIRGVKLEGYADTDLGQEQNSLTDIHYYNKYANSIAENSV